MGEAIVYDDIVLIGRFHSEIANWDCGKKVGTIGEWYMRLVNQAVVVIPQRAMWDLALSGFNGSLTWSVHIRVERAIEECIFPWLGDLMR